MVSALLPIVSPAAYAASSQFDSILEMDKVEPSGYDPDSTENPYGYKLNEPFLLNTINELLLYQTYDVGEAGGNLSTTSYNDAIKNNAFNSSDTTSLYNTKDYLYVEAVAFDPTGSARKDHVAYIGLDYNYVDPEYSVIKVWVQDTVTGEVKHEWSSSSVASWFAHNEDMYQHEAGNFFAITAGDYSGNGKETIVAYIATENLTYGLVELRYNAETEALSQLDDIVHQDMLHPKYVTEDFGQAMARTTDKRNKLSCDLATGDFNGDGIDDLAVLSYINRANGSSGGYNWSKIDCAYYWPWLKVAYGQADGGQSGRHQGVLDNNKSGFSELKHNWRTDEDGTKHYRSMIAPGIAAGDTDGDGKDEITVSGYENIIKSQKNSYNCDAPFDIDKDEILIASFDAENGLGQIAINDDITRFNKVDANGWLSGTSTSIFTNDSVWQPMGVECVAFNGHANKELVFIGGTIYDVDGSPSVKYTPDYFTKNDAAVGSVAINTGFIPSMAVGNFDGNKYGYEQIIFAVGLKEYLQDDYFYLRGFIGREYDKATGELKVEGNKDAYYSNGDNSGDPNHISNTLIIGNKGDDFDEVLNCVFVPIDRDRDGTMVKYVGVDYAYSDPQVIAVLQAAPWFGELGDDYGATTYTFTQEYEYTLGTSNSVSFGAGGVLSLEGTIGSIDTKIGYVMDWTKSFENTLLRSTSDSFTAKAYDSVVVYRTPVYIYKYEAFDEKNNQWYGDGMSISVPKTPTYIQMSVSDYNAFADAYNQLGQANANGKPFQEMEKLNLDWLGNEGNPWGYSSSIQSISSATYRLGYNGGETSSSSADGTAYTQTISQAHGFTFEMTATFGFDAGFVSSKAGFWGSLDYMKESSESTSTSSSTETSGTVQDLDDMALLRDGIPESVTRSYGFTWALGKTTRNLGVAGKDVLILGYKVTDITAPAPPVIDLEAELKDEGSVELTWSKPSATGRLPVHGYYVYQKDGDTYQRLNENMLGVNESSYEVSGLDSNTEYTFVVTTYHNEKGESVWSNEAAITTPKKNVPLHLVYDRNDVRVTATHLGNVDIASGESVPEESIVYVEILPAEGSTVTRVTLTSGGNTEEITSADGRFNFVIRDETTIEVEAARVAIKSYVSYTGTTFDEEELQIGSLTATVGGYAFGPSGAEVYDAVEFTAAPAAGYVLKEWQIDTDGSITPVAAAGSNTLTFYPYSESHHVTAVYAREDDPDMQQKVLIRTADGGTIAVVNASGITLTPDENGYISVYRGTDLTFEIDTNKYYTFKKWTDAFEAYSRDMTSIPWKALEDITVGAEFYANLLYPVTFSAIHENDSSGTLTAEANGSAIHSGDKFVPETTVSFDAQAGSDSRILKWAISEGTIITFKHADGLIENDAYTIESLSAISNVDAYFKTIEQYTLTIATPENGSISVKRGETELESGDNIKFGDVLTITATPADGYILSALTANGSPFTSGDTFTVQDHVTIAAAFSKKPSSGGGESGGGGILPEDPELTIEIRGDEQVVQAAALVSGHIVTIKAPSEKELKTVSDAAADAGKLVSVDLSPLSSDLDTAIIPNDILSGIVASFAAGIEIIMPDGKSVSFDNEAIEALISAGSDDLKLCVRAVSTDSLTDAQRRLVGDGLVINLTAYIGTKQVYDFDGGLATVSIPVDGDPTEYPIVWRMTTGEDGKVKLEAIECIYNSMTNCYEFRTGTFSEYVLGNYPFTDTPDTAWYYEDTVYAYVNGLFAGTTDTTFSPDLPMTRGMLVTVLWRMEGSPAVTDAANFSDVDHGVWYTDAVSWAAANDIVVGYGNDKFGPNDPVTREQMAAILYRYAQCKGYDISVGEDTNILSYKDVLDVSEYAIPAMRWACGASLIQGSGGNLMPQGDATRSQVAAILYRFDENLKNYKTIS
ncbi:MAG: S-layer homology domain-containing protein [Oscillospiraceae bacterium]